MERRRRRRRFSRTLRASPDQPGEESADPHRSLSDHSARIVGSRLALMAVAAVIAVWVIFGLATGPTKEWLMATTMLATLATCLILVLLQHSQNRDMRALQAKLDGPIRSSGARNLMIGVERLERDEDIPVVGG
ncbi:low affinity iron permease family protein [Rhizobium mongolense]